MSCAIVGGVGIIEFSTSCVADVCVAHSSAPPAADPTPGSNNVDQPLTWRDGEWVTPTPVQIGGSGNPLSCMQVIAPAVDGTFYGRVDKTLLTGPAAGGTVHTPFTLTPSRMAARQ